MHPLCIGAAHMGPSTTTCGSGRPSRSDLQSPPEPRSRYRLCHRWPLAVGYWPSRRKRPPPSAFSANPRGPRGADPPGGADDMRRAAQHLQRSMCVVPRSPCRAPTPPSPGPTILVTVERMVAKGALASTAAAPATAT
eukprot:366045-Chlamydomonas_euryale.AAC.7